MSDVPAAGSSGPPGPAPAAGERFRAILDQLMVGVLEADLAGRLLLVNDRYCDILGYAREELLGRQVQDFTHPDDVAEIRRLIARLCEFGEPFVAEKRYRRKDGSLVWVETTASILRDSGGKPQSVVAVNVDITQRKEAEHALRESEARFRNMADNAPVMVWVTEPDGACSYLSQSWYAFTGQTPETALGFGWMEAVHPEDRARAERTFAEANARRQPFRLDYRLCRRDGVYRWAIDAAAPRFGPAGEFLGYIGSVIDITERQEAETTRELLVRELNHRVKNMLAVVQGLAHQTARRAPDLQHFLPSFEGRLEALSRAHSLLTEQVWRGAALHDLVTDQCLLGDDARVTVTGPPVVLEPQQAVHVALVLHEMCTNARKYGALTVPTGRVNLDWTVTDGCLDLQWRESGGPPVAPNPEQGFGTLLIVQTIRSNRGEAHMHVEASGIDWSIRLPLRPLAGPGVD